MKQLMAPPAPVPFGGPVIEPEYFIADIDVSDAFKKSDVTRIQGIWRRFEPKLLARLNVGQGAAVKGSYDRLVKALFRGLSKAGLVEFKKAWKDFDPNAEAQLKVSLSLLAAVDREESPEMKATLRTAAALTQQDLTVHSATAMVLAFEFSAHRDRIVRLLEDEDPVTCASLEWYTYLAEAERQGTRLNLKQLRYRAFKDWFNKRSNTDRDSKHMDPLIKRGNMAQCIVNKIGWTLAFLMGASGTSWLVHPCDQFIFDVLLTVVVRTGWECRGRCSFLMYSKSYYDTRVRPSMTCRLLEMFSLATSCTSVH